MDTVKDIRKLFAIMYKNEIFVPDKTGQNCIEILGAQFLADDVTIFGLPNQKYISREIGWYLSQSLDINKMEEPIPYMWKSVASKEGQVNSNYGFLVHGVQNYQQYLHCQGELQKNPFSRRAIMIYTRPSMWVEYNEDGKSDFICTNTVQYFIRQNPQEPSVLRLFAYISMRSNDAWSGYRNDLAWQRFVFESLYKDLLHMYPTLKRGAIIWNCGSLHLYERNFDLVQHYIDTGNHIPPSNELIVTRKRLVESGVIREQ